jgi:hypothetical protein
VQPPDDHIPYFENKNDSFLPARINVNASNADISRYEAGFVSGHIYYGYLLAGLHECSKSSKK